MSACGVKEDMLLGVNEDAPAGALGARMKLRNGDVGPAGAGNCLRNADRGASSCFLNARVVLYVSMC